MIFIKNEYLLKKGSELNLVPSKNTLQCNSEYSLEKGHSLMIDNRERERGWVSEEREGKGQVNVGVT